MLLGPRPILKKGVKNNILETNKAEKNVEKDSVNKEEIESVNTEEKESVKKEEMNGVKKDEKEDVDNSNISQLPEESKTMESVSAGEKVRIKKTGSGRKRLKVKRLTEDSTRKLESANSLPDKEPTTVRKIRSRPKTMPGGRSSREKNIPGKKNNSNNGMTVENSESITTVKGSDSSVTNVRLKNISSGKIGEPRSRPPSRTRSVKLGKKKSKYIIRRRSQKSVRSSGTPPVSEDVGSRNEKQELPEENKVKEEPSDPLSEKSYWVDRAIAQLGSKWTGSGFVSQDVLNSPDFRTAMEAFYDSTVVKKKKKMANLIKDVANESQIDLGSAKAPPQTAPPSTSSKHKETKKKLSAQFEAQMSSLLFKFILERTKQPPSTSGAKKEETTKVEVPLDESKNQKMTPNVSRKSSNLELPQNVGKVRKTENTENTILDDIAELPQRRYNTYIYEGTIFLCSHEVAKHFSSSFAPMSESRKRKDPLAKNYFRSSVNMVGFLDQEIHIKWFRGKIVVEGIRPQRDDLNARYCKEIIPLPSPGAFEPEQIKIFRSRKGLLVLEEMFVLEERASMLTNV